MKRFSIFMIAVAAMTVADLYAGEVVYTRFNIHYFMRSRRDKVDYVASCVNYVDAPSDAGFLPYNTPVTVGRWRGGFMLNVKDSDKKIHFEFSPRFMLDMTVDDYVKLITSEKKVEYDDLNKADKEGIEKGKVKPGMTKQGVKIAWGHPATHKTRSLDEDTWFYWRNRFAMIAVSFEDGKVVSVK